MKVLTLNVWNQNWHWPKRLSIIQDLLKFKGLDGSGNDVLVFHELTTTVDHNQLREMNLELGYESVLEFVAKEEDGKTYSMGLLTNLDIIRHEYIPLTQDPDDPDDTFPRGVCLLEFMKKSKTYVFVITHFAISTKAQERNARECIEHIVVFNPDDVPVIICGDLNCAPNEKAVQIFKEQGYVDEWIELQPKEFATWPVEEGLILDNHKLKHGNVPKWHIKPRRVDYILTKGIRARSIDKVGTEVNGIWHSDHWGLLAEI